MRRRAAGRHARDGGHARRRAQSHGLGHGLAQPRVQRDAGGRGHQRRPVRHVGAGAHGHGRRAVCREVAELLGDASRRVAVKRERAASARGT
jgi:hypothetical protein